MAKAGLDVGEFGEELAASFLAEKGYRIVGRRVRTRHGELDIVAKDGDAWVFVEVKARTGVAWGRAEEAFTRKKSSRVTRAAREYVDRHNLWDATSRCDLVAIDFDADMTPRINHYVNAAMME